MGAFYKTFNEKIREVWKLATQLDKPVRENLTWTVGIINGRCDFEDLQAHGAALMASIIIKEKVVPKIICVWDTPTDTNTSKWDLEERQRIYPLYLLRLFDEFDESFLEKPKIFSCNRLSNQYVSLHRAGWSVNPIPSGLTLGYRAKYLGLNYVRTTHAIMSDIDTICTDECCDYVQENIDRNPETFCLTNYYDNENVSVGLVAFNMRKYREVYLPLWHEMYWKLPKADAKFIQAIRKEYLECQDELDIQLMDKNVVNTEKYYHNIPRKNHWVDDKSKHYHAWKGEMEQNTEEFNSFYNDILDNLIKDAKTND